jgi:hypothetical protein
VPFLFFFSLFFGYNGLTSSLAKLVMSRRSIAVAVCDSVNYCPVGTPRGRFDEYSSKFSLSKKPRFNRIQEKAKHLKVMPASFATAPNNLYGTSSKLCFTSSNVEPAHNITKYFAPNLR